MSDNKEWKNMNTSNLVLSLVDALNELKAEVDREIEKTNDQLMALVKVVEMQARDESEDEQ